MHDVGPPLTRGSPEESAEAGVVRIRDLHRLATEKPPQQPCAPQYGCALQRDFLHECTSFSQNIVDGPVVGRAKAEQGEIVPAGEPDEESRSRSTSVARVESGGERENGENPQPRIRRVPVDR
jgi:hypothetical protein